MRFFSLIPEIPNMNVLFIPIVTLCVCCALVIILENSAFSFITGIIAISAAVTLVFRIRKIKDLQENLSLQNDIAINGYSSFPYAFFIFDSSWNCIFSNKTAEELFSGKAPQFFTDFMEKFEANHIKAIESIKSSVIDGKPSYTDILFSSEDGSSWWRISAAPFLKFPGHSAWCIADLTPSSRAASEVSPTFLMDMIQSSPVGYFTVNASGEIIFCSRTFGYWVGDNCQNIINKKIENIFIREKSDALPMAGGPGRFIKSLPSKMVLFSNQHSDGYEVMVRQVLVSDDGNIRTYVATKDLAQGSELFQALGESKWYFENIFEDAPVGIVITEGPDIINACNETFREMASPDEEIEEGSSFFSYIKEEIAVNNKLCELLASTKSNIKPFEVSFKHKENRVSMVYADKLEDRRLGKKRDKNGLVLYFVDVTEHKQLEQQFVQSQKMQAVGQLAGGIAHDFNNLLTAMIGYCDLLLTKCSPADQSFTDVMQIKQNANRASNLVRQLLAFSRQQTLQPKVLNITDNLAELSALLRRLLGATIELKVIHGRELGLIKVDQVQFEQVIINLAVNARDAMSNDGVLTIKTSSYSSNNPTAFRSETMPPGSYVLIEISDTGLGIPHENLQRIFEPFFSTKEKGSGTGLGLSTAYGIIKQTGGFISVESVEKEGTKFLIYIPVYTKPAPIKIPKIDNNPIIADLTGSGTILFVEDEDAVRMFGVRALRDKGYRVIEANSGEVALDWLKKEPVDLLISDVVMPRMDGLTLVEEAKQYKPNLKVIFISGYAEDSFRKNLSIDQEIHFLPKPFNLKELAEKVKAVLI